LVAKTIGYKSVSDSAPAVGKLPNKTMHAITNNIRSFFDIFNPFSPLFVDYGRAAWIWSQPLNSNRRVIAFPQKRKLRVCEWDDVPLAYPPLSLKWEEIAQVRFL
jgi:hypothetical protein